MDQDRKVEVEGVRLNWIYFWLDVLFKFNSVCDA